MGKEGAGPQLWLHARVILVVKNSCFVLRRPN